MSDRKHLLVSPFRMISAQLNALSKRSEVTIQGMAILDIFPNKSKEQTSICSSGLVEELYFDVTTHRQRLRNFKVHELVFRCVLNWRNISSPLAGRPQTEDLHGQIHTSITLIEMFLTVKSYFDDSASSRHKVVILHL